MRYSEEEGFPSRHCSRSKNPCSFESNKIPQSKEQESVFIQEARTVHHYCIQAFILSSIMADTKVSQEFLKGMEKCVGWHEVENLR